MPVDLPPKALVKATISNQPIAYARSIALVAGFALVLGTLMLLASPFGA